MPTEALDAAARLKYRDFILVALILKESLSFEDQWLYIHDPEYIVGRIQNFKNWSPELLDGSGNVDVDGQMGTIFGIYRRATHGPVQMADFQQSGNKLVAAGYVLYGPSTMFVYTAGGPVSGFTLDRSIGTFFLTHPDLKIPEGTGSYSVNEGNEAKWDEKTKALVRAFRTQETRCGKRGARYAGALVGDFHRTLLKGGIYMYPGEVKKAEGKLRLLYENAPLAFVCEHAGGMATDGRQRILDIVPGQLHQRTPLYIGSKGDVEEAMERLR